MGSTVNGFGALGGEQILVEDGVYVDGMVPQPEGSAVNFGFQDEMTQNQNEQATVGKQTTSEAHVDGNAAVGGVQVILCTSSGNEVDTHATKAYDERIRRRKENEFLR